MTEQQPVFDDFYNNPVICAIADNERWTVSDKNKKPIDMFSFEYRNQIHGALFTNELSLVTLPKLKNILPNATNNTYFLDAMVDKIVILDIEPKCPEPIKKQLLKLPYIYGETSMSGKGYHLVFPLPQIIEKYPIAAAKKVLKENNGYYEILMHHWVTFTRNSIPCHTKKTKFEKLFEKMASEQKDHIRHDIDIEKIKPDNIPRYEQIIEALMRQTYQKTSVDFYNDMSRYEYATIGFFYYKLENILSAIKKYEHHDYTDNEKAWLLYVVIEQKIKYREKHDTLRSGLPWLLYLTQELIARNIGQQQKERTDKK